MHGAKGGAKLRKRLGKVLTSIKANQGGGSSTSSSKRGAGVEIGHGGVVVGAAGGLQGLVAPAAKRTKVG